MDGTIPGGKHGQAAMGMAVAMGGAALSVLPDPTGADHLDAWTVLVRGVRGWEAAAHRPACRVSRRARA